MPRVIVITEDRKPGDEESVLLNEQVQSIHLDTEHSAGQFIQRLGWAISDAEDAERSADRRRGARGSPDPRPRSVVSGCSERLPRRVLRVGPSRARCL